MFNDMKKIRFFKRGFSFTIATIMILFTVASSKPYKVEAATTSVSQLKVSGSQLCDANGNAIQLKGMSSHGLQWSVGNYMNYDSMKFLRDNWGVNVVRAAMYTGENGYISNPTTTKARVKEIVQAAIDLNMYVVIDWHILSDNNPNTYKEQAKSFFQEMAKTYGNTPNVIYEICNEPNGVNWSSDIKPYADYIIPAIRAIDPDNIIIVGTSNWSQDVDVAASNPLSYSNIMYTCHFYAGSHGQELRDKINTAMSKGAAVFVTEWGTSDASGDGGPYLDKAQQWIDFLNSKKISWINWSLANTSQTSSALKSNANTKGGWTDSDLTTSGLFVKKNISGTSSTTPVTDIPTQGSTTTPVTDTPETTGKPISNVSVTSAIATDWGSGATIHLTIKNNNSTPINGWTLSWSLPSNQSITAMWNGTYTQNGSTINVTSDSSHSYIAANGGTQTLVYNINYSGSNAQPTNFTLGTSNSTSNVSSQDITYEVSPDWGSGATIHLTIKNNSSTPINGWTLSCSLPNNQIITDMWNGTYTKSGSTINVKSDSSHSYIAANGGTQTLVYNINYIGSNTKPTNFILNGTPCPVK